MAESKLIPITACLMVQDEEKHIARAINNIKDQVCSILVVDGGSSDNTVEIARSLGAKVYERKFDFDFSAQRNFLMSKVETEWALWLDADEYFSDMFFNLLPALVLKTPEKCVAYHVYRISKFDGEIKGNDFQWRLMKKDFVKWTGKIHEGIEFMKGTKGLKVPEQYCMMHEHTMKRQLWNNSLYYNINNGKLERPATRSGMEYQQDKWVFVENDREG